MFNEIYIKIMNEIMKYLKGITSHDGREFTECKAKVT